MEIDEKTMKEIADACALIKVLASIKVEELSRQKADASGNGDVWEVKRLSDEIDNLLKHL